ncbi:hypothetical protein ABZ883_04785 [Streptomyces sp. NPDC046977]|uniref:hypothetical protein n=1 Tax=Streptomyces sp. NPDC046977 TaxID=3154703 RepID=UPI0033F63D83
MGSPLLLRRLADVYRREFTLLHGMLDASVQKVSAMTASAVKAPNGPAMSALARTELLGFASSSLAVRRSRLRLIGAGDEWVRVGLTGSEVRPRLRMRPPTAELVDPFLFDEATLRGPAGSIVVMWDWDENLGTLRSLSLTRVESMQRWGIKCPMLEEIPIAAPAVGSVDDPFRHSVPIGAANDDDDLAGVVGVWDEEEEAQSEQQLSGDRSEDGRDDDEGDSAVGGLR